jgi:hypothetical protein
VVVWCCTHSLEVPATAPQTGYMPAGWSTGVGNAAPYGSASSPIQRWLTCSAALSVHLAAAAAQQLCATGSSCARLGLLTAACGSAANGCTNQSWCSKTIIAHPIYAGVVCSMAVGCAGWQICWSDACSQISRQAMFLCVTCLTALAGKRVRILTPKFECNT